MESRAPSGLFPSRPSRPTFREPHPIRLPAVAAGAGSTVLWLVLMGMLADSLAAYLWLTLAAALVAWACALVLVRFGDRGVAIGVGLAAGAGLSVAVMLLVLAWAGTGWPLW